MQFFFLNQTHKTASGMGAPKSIKKPGGEDAVLLQCHLKAGNDWTSRASWGMELHIPGTAAN